MQSSNQSYGSQNSSLNNSNSSQHNSYLVNQSGNLSGGENGQQLVETRIEDGKLWYERRWYHRGQAVTIEGRDIPRFSANISAIGNEIIWVKRISDNGKVRIYLKQLQTGKISIKRRAN
jgi:Sin3 histone deacetylase corepressor complex component SDS3